MLSLPGDSGIDCDQWIRWNEGTIGTACHRDPMSYKSPDGIQMWELAAWNCPEISLSMVINEGRLRYHYDSKRGNTLCQCRRTDRAVFDTMPVVNPWAPLQSILYCGARSLHGSLFDGVKYSLKPGLMDTRKHLI